MLCDPEDNITFANADVEDGARLTISYKMALKENEVGDVAVVVCPCVSVVCVCQTESFDWLFLPVLLLYQRPIGLLSVCFE